jgi:hypothetical protein
VQRNDFVKLSERMPMKTREEGNTKKDHIVERLTEEIFQKSKE